MCWVFAVRTAFYATIGTLALTNCVDSLEKQVVDQDHWIAGLRSIPVRDIETRAARKTKLRFEFRNETGNALRYMHARFGPTNCASLKLLLFQDDKLIPWAKTPEGPSWVKLSVRTLKPNDTLEGIVDLERYRQLKPGQYDIRAEYDVSKTHWAVKKFGLTPLSFNRTVMILHIIESLPKKLNRQTRFRFTRVEEKSRYVLAADVGLGPAWDGKSTLFFAVRVSDAGKTKLKEPPESILRPLRVDPKSKIETMVYDPFPNSEDAIIQVHVLVTEPNKRQHHLVVDLTETGNPKLPTVKKKETLKPGTLYKLHKTKLGDVKLVPRAGK